LKRREEGEAFLPRTPARRGDAALEDLLYRADEEEEMELAGDDEGEKMRAQSSARNRNTGSEWSTSAQGSEDSA
jgi:hypothetical protein